MNETAYTDTNRAKVFGTAVRILAYIRKNRANRKF